MPAHDAPQLDTVVIQDWVDQQAAIFDQAWRAGPPPSIRDFVTRAPSDRRLPLLRELIKIDLEYRTRSGEPLSIDKYYKEFVGELSNADSEVLADLEAHALKLSGGSGTNASNELGTVFIGKYKIIRELDRGGQAIVYRGTHPQLDNDVVIKLSKLSFEPGAPGRNLLLAEGRILAQLNHPHIARVYDFDFHDDHPFLVMEYVRGRNLEQYAGQDRPSPQEAAALVAKVARALGVAHRAGVIHQDVKPKNILIDETGEPRLIDFGLARIRHGWQEDTSSSGGTVVYMAPEQALGHSEQIQTWSDIFALGGVLYRFFTGRAPFASRTSADALMKAQNCDFDRESIRRAGVPRRLEAICLKAMAEKPSERFATADDLADALERAANPPKYWRWVLPAAALLVVTLGIVALRYEWGPFAKPAAVDPGMVKEPELKRLTVAVYRGERVRPKPLTRAVALRPGDTYRVEAEVPAQVHAAIYFVDTNGKLESLMGFEPAEKPQLITYPRPKTDPPQIGTQPFGGATGTVFILAVGKASGPITDDEVRQSLELEDKLPELPVDSVIHVRKDSVQAVGDPEDTPRGEPVSYHADLEGVMKKKLDTVRARLLDRGFTWVEGYAFRQPGKVVED